MGQSHVAFEPVLHGHVPDEHRPAGGRAAHRGRRAGHPRNGEQGTVHLAQLDPPAAQLDLVVSAPDEHEPRRLVPHQVAAAVCASPAEGGHRGVLLGVLHRVEVTSEPHSADDQLAHLAVGDRLQLGTDDREVPAVQRQPDPHRGRPVQPGGARDHRGLGRTVGVPHLATVRRQPRRQLGRTRLTAKDQQPDLGQCRRGPERHQGRDRRHDGDPVGDHPRPEVHAAAHERPRCRDQAGTVGPGQPHLLAGGVERDRQAGHHPVPRTDRPVLEEQPCLGIHERRRAAVLHRHALRSSGRPRGEDDPGVVLGPRLLRDARGCALRPDLDHQVRADQRGHLRLVEHQPSPCVRVVRVDRDIRRSGQQYADDRDIQLRRPGRYADPHPVSPTDAGPVELQSDRLGGLEHLAVGQDVRTAVDRGIVRPLGGGLAEDRHQGSWRGSPVGPQQAHDRTDPPAGSHLIRARHPAVAVPRFRSVRQGRAGARSAFSRHRSRCSGASRGHAPNSSAAGGTVEDACPPGRMTGTCNPSRRAVDLSGRRSSYCDRQDEEER